MSNLVMNPLKNAFGSTVNQWAFRLAKKGNKSSRYLKDLFNKYFIALDLDTTNLSIQEEYNYYYGLTATLIFELEWLLKFKAGNFAGVFSHTNARFNIKIDIEDIQKFKEDLKELEAKFIKDQFFKMPRDKHNAMARNQAYKNAKEKYERDIKDLGDKITNALTNPLYLAYYNEGFNEFGNLEIIKKPSINKNNRGRNAAKIIKKEINKFRKNLNNTHKAIKQLNMNYKTRHEAISAETNTRANGGAGGPSRFDGGTRKKRRSQ